MKNALNSVTAKAFLSIPKRHQNRRNNGSPMPRSRGVSCGMQIPKRCPLTWQNFKSQWLWTSIPNPSFSLKARLILITFLNRLAKFKRAISVTLLSQSMKPSLSNVSSGLWNIGCLLRKNQLLLLQIPMHFSPTTWALGVVLIEKIPQRHQMNSPIWLITIAKVI